MMRCYDSELPWGLSVSHPSARGVTTQAERVLIFVYTVNLIPEVPAGVHRTCISVTRRTPWSTARHLLLRAVLPSCPRSSAAPSPPRFLCTDQLLPAACPAAVALPFPPPSPHGLALSSHSRETFVCMSVPMMVNMSHTLSRPFRGSQCGFHDILELRALAGWAEGSDGW